MKQLSLFDWTPRSPTRTIIPFPQERRKGEIRRLAASIQKKNGRAADRLWQHQVDHIRRQMTKAGFSEDEVDLAVSTFHSAVQTELDRVAWIAGGQGVDGGYGGPRNG